MDPYLRTLGAELRRLGVPARRRRRILAEARDHLRSDPATLARFGDARAIAQECADELGGTAARRLSVAAFAVLAVAGAVFSALLLAIFTVVPARALACCTATPPAQVITLAVLVVAPQVAFVSGVLALIRAVRLRGHAPLPAAEVRTLRRRSAVALASGVASMGALALFVTEYAALLPAWSQPAVYAGTALSVLLVLPMAVPLVVTSRIRVQTAGTAGDVFADVGGVVPAPLRGHPWAFAGVVAAVVAVAVLAPGVAADDAFDAALRALAETLACLAGFAALGRFLSLRH